MKENKKSNGIKYLLTAVCCAGGLLLGGCSDTGEGTWKQEYENCMAAMEQGISERSMAEQQEQGNLTCVGNQSGGMEGEEDVYRTATFLMTAMCEENGGSYEFRYEHGEDTEKAQEDFRAVIEGENPIDESMDSLCGDFGIYYYADALIIEMGRDAWQEEFFHCLDMVRNRVRESGDEDKEQFLETLEALEDFFEVWIENERACKWLEYHRIGIDDEERNEWINLGRGGLRIWQAESETEIFRTGTLLLIDGLEKSGGSYEFIYDRESDRQELIHFFEGEKTDTGPERMYSYKISVHTGIGFDTRQGIVISPGNEDLEDSVPEELILELSAALQNDALEDYVAGISAEYVLLQEDQIMQYIRKDTSGMLESFYYDYMEDGGEWFLFERDNGIIVRQKIDHEKYPYCYYQFPCEGELYGPAICAYGKNEDCYFISWEDNDYLVVTRREEGQVKGIAVYQRYSATQSEWYNSRPTGWIMGLEKTSDGEIQVTLYTYVYTGGYIWGKFLDY